MKVYIGPYKSWLGPYQLAEKLCFWAKKEKDEHGFPKTPDWVHNFGEWLAHGDIEPEPTKENPKSLFNKKRKTTLLYRFLIWLESKRSRSIYIKIDKYDTWSMDSTLSMIILPMLKQLKETKHGSHMVDDEDVPDEIKSTSAPPRENEWDSDDNLHKRWDYVLDEMIWAFEQLNDDTWENQYHTGERDLQSEVCEWDENGKPKLYRMIEGPNHTSKFDSEGHKKHNDRINRGLVLFGKYYRGLWD